MYDRNIVKFGNILVEKLLTSSEADCVVVVKGVAASPVEVVNPLEMFH